MRARLIKPDFFEDRELCDLPLGARFLFIGLWCLADRDGRLLDIPKRIAIEVFPYEDLEESVCKWLNQLSPHWITRYTENGKQCISVNAFKLHQKIHPSERKSTLPAPPSKNLMRTSLEPHEVLTPTQLESRSEAEAEAEAERGFSVRSAQPIDQDLDDVEDIARRVYKRHPNRQRAGALKLVMDAIVEVLADAVHPRSLALKIDRGHERCCKSRSWTKDGGEFAPGLAKWIKSREWDCDDEPAAEERPQYRAVSDIIGHIRGGA